jgi:hypothetical protein
MAAAFLPGTGGTALAAGEAPDPDRVQLRPILDARVRYENVDQPALEGDALTLRLRAGAEARLGRFSLLAEGETTVAPVADYNAFPFPLAGQSQRRPGFAVVADPANAELNRLQVQYRAGTSTVTLGRQRINLDDQRWVGSVGWRQNEQTFDAVRGEASLGPVGVDLTYAVSQRTIFGEDAGPRTAYGGDFLFAGLSSRLGPIQGKLFAYLLDYEEDFFLANSSQSYGGILSASVPLDANRTLNLRASYARQSDYGANPFDYAADYWSFEGGTTLAGFTVTAGWEQLGSDNGRAVQTPMATLHKFNGWADLFLTTPATGLEDAYVSIGRRFEGLRRLPGLNATLAFHQFDSAAGDIEFGTEWDASIGFRVGRTGILAKIADYQAGGFGTDTRRIWLQAEWSF